MKLLLVLLCFSVNFSLFAEFKEKPDTNTLWSEDGKGITAWRDGLKVEEHPDGGFLVSPGTGYSTGRYVPANQEYPWLVGEILNCTLLEGYRGFTFYSGGFAMVASPQKGMFATKTTFKNAKPFFRIDLHGLELHFAYLKQVKKPDYYIECKTVDNKLQINVYLKEEAEDVMIRFYDSYHVKLLRINGADKVQLYPKDENNPVHWQAEIPKPDIKVTGKFLVKAVILGGEIKVPLWGIAPK